MKIVVLLFLAFQLGCTQREAARSDTLLVALTAAPSNLDPRYALDATSQRLATLLFDALVTWGPDLKIVGQAATDWTYRNRIYIFRLRPDLTFANGMPVTKADLEFTFAEFRKPASPFASTLKAIRSVKIDFDHQPHTVEIALETFSQSLLGSLTAIKILPKDLVDENFGRNPLGSGPYMMKSQSANEVRMTARTSPTRPTPQIANLVFKIVRDDSTRYYKVLKGEVDIAQSVLPPGQIENFVNNPKFQVYKATGTSMAYLIPNLREPVFKNKLVREAIAMAINRDEIIRYKLADLAVPATTILSPENPAALKDLVNPPFNPERARRILINAGLIGRELTLKTSNSEQVVENARVLANQLEKIGFKVKLQSFEWATFYDDIKNGRFQLAMLEWVGVVDPDIYRLAFHSREFPPGRNRGYYSNPTLDRILDQGLMTEDPVARAKLYGEAQRLIAADIPIIPLWHYTQVGVVNSRIKNYTLSPMGDYQTLVTVRKEP